MRRKSAGVIGRICYNIHIISNLNIGMYFLFFVLGFITASILLALYILLSQNTETKQRIKSSLVKTERAVLGKVDRLEKARKRLQEQGNLDIDDLV